MSPVFEKFSPQRDPIELRAPAVIAIPANNEADHIKRCLAALAMQRDGTGAPVPSGAFQILVFANNCTDGTADIVNAFAANLPHPLDVVEERLPPARRSAGWARKRAMDLAAAAMTGHRLSGGVILTTDADSAVAPTWFAATMQEFERGADCVAGYIDAYPPEMVRLGRDFLARGRLEDTYLRLIAEIEACCDPRPHDPWPNHRVASGASLAVTLAAYRAIGGLPPRPVGEDAALTKALERASFKVRHSMDVSVSTSCRFDGRAKGGAADTMRQRHDELDAACDDNIEPALEATRRALCRRMVRSLWEQRAGGPDAVLARLRIFPASAWSIRNAFAGPFDDVWDRACEASPILNRRRRLRPSELPRQISIARMILRHLRTQAKTVPAGTSRLVKRSEPAIV